jgi:AcrR family transcriptional regulator
MEIQRSDRRISRTRRHLRDALLALILEKGYDSVTVEDITQRADLGRTTFYLHFRDKEELLLTSLESVAEELKEKIGVNEDAQPDFQESAKAITTVFHHARENASLYLIILNGGAALHALNRLHSVIAQTAVIFFEKRAKILDRPLEIPVDVLAAYFAASLLSFLTWWLRRETPEPPEEMARIFNRLIARGMLSVLL